MSRVSRIGAWASALLLIAATSASAVPITYNNPQLEPGQTRLGVQTQPNGNPNNPVGAQYFFFAANAGSSVTINVDRLSAGYDPAMWIFSGLFTDTNQFGGSFDSGDAPFSNFSDDTDPPFTGVGSGPFGDPRAVFNAPTTGFYTAAVTNFLSSGSPPFNFQITGTGILATPEPVSMVAFALAGLAGVAYVRRRKQVAIA